jgi:hypothetical protein
MVWGATGRDTWGNMLELLSEIGWNDLKEPERRGFRSLAVKVDNARRK